MLGYAKIINMFKKIVLTIWVATLLFGIGKTITTLLSVTWLKELSQNPIELQARSGNTIMQQVYSHSRTIPLDSTVAYLMGDSHFDPLFTRLCVEFWMFPRKTIVTQDQAYASNYQSDYIYVFYKVDEGKILEDFPQYKLDYSTAVENNVVITRLSRK